MYYVYLCVLYISYIQITRLCEIRRGKTPGENVPLCYEWPPGLLELFPLLADQRAFFLVVFSASDYVASILNAFLVTLYRYFELNLKILNM